MSEPLPTTIASSKGLKVFILGLGPGDGRFLTPQAVKIIEFCGIIVGWPSAIAAIKDRANTKIIFEQNCDNYRLALWAASEAAKLGGKQVAVLVMDDPLTYSAGIDSYKAPFADFDLVFVPSIGNMQLAAAAAHVSLEESLSIVYSPAADGAIDKDDLVEKRRRMLKGYKNNQHLIVMSDVEQNLSQTAKYLLENGLPNETEVIVGEQLGSDDEKITIKDLAGVAIGCYHWMSVMVIKAHKL